MLQLLFDRRKVSHIINRPGTDHHIRLSFQDRLDQFLNIGRAVLVIRICIDDYVRAVSKAPVQTGYESFRKPFVLSEAHDMMHAPFPCHFHRIIQAAVVHDQIFDLINAV